jgi:cytoskeletal protein RodZ
MTSPGELLKQERLRQQRSLEELASSLRIMRRYLEAIERNDPQSLPGGPFYYKAFVRQYAAALGLDENKLHDQVEQVASALEPPRLPGIDDHRHPVRDRDADPIVSETNRQLLSERQFGPAWIALLVVLVCCSAFYAWWTRNQWQFPWEKNALTQATPSPSPAQPGANPEDIQFASSDTAAAREPARQPASDSSLSDAGTLSDDMAQVTLSVSATEPTWLSVVSDGKQVFSGVLQPSESKTLEGREAARIKVGNAGGLEVRWNGKPIGPLGPRGQVRVVNFTKDNYEILHPQPRREEF